MNQTITGGARLFFPLLLAIASQAATIITVPHEKAENLVFGRYIESIQDRNPLTESGPVMLEIDASVPGLYKEARVLAMRQTDAAGRATYAILQMDGDGIVMQEVVANYLEALGQIEDQPFSSIAISPANYKFRYLGEVGGQVASTRVFRITPKSKRDGLVQGELWIDSATGSEVLCKGMLAKTPAPFVGPVQLVRETTMVENNASIRVTHVTVESRRLGRGELTVTELPMGLMNRELLNPNEGAPHGASIKFSPK